MNKEVIFQAAARLHLLCWVCANESRKAATCRLGEPQCTEIQHLHLRKRRQVHVRNNCCQGFQPQVSFFFFYFTVNVSSEVEREQFRHDSLRTTFVLESAASRSTSAKSSQHFFRQKKKKSTRLTSHINEHVWRLQSVKYRNMQMNLSNDFTT